MNIDLRDVTLEPLDMGQDAFRESLDRVLNRVAPLTAMPVGLGPEAQMRRLTEAINVALDALEEVSGMSDAQRLPDLIDRVTLLAVTGDNLEVQIGVAGDLRVDRRQRLNVDNALASLGRIPPAARPAAQREGVTALRRLLALLLLHGWADNGGHDQEARNAARQAIVDTVQGRAFAGQPTL